MAGISYIPVLPFLSDSEEKLDEMIRSAKIMPSEEYQKELEEKSRRLCEKYGIKIGLFSGFGMGIQVI